MSRSTRPSPRAFARLAEKIDPAQGPRHLPVDRAVPVQGDHRRAGRRRADRRPRPPRARKAARQRPRLEPRDQRRRRRRLPRGAHLPHRPLSRQGNRPEPPRPALRQFDVRAAVEFGAHRPCPDQRRRDRRARRPRRLLRRRRRAARHGPEPHAAIARAGGDGAAGRLRRDLGARRKGQGAALAAPDPRRRGRRPRGHRPVSRRRGRRRAGQGLCRRARPRRRTPRRSSR